MKILQITFHLASGGAERFAVDLCNELSKNHEVHLLTINDDKNGNNSHYKSELSPRVIYHCLGCKKGICFDSIIKVYKAIKEIAPDVVHTHTAPINVYLPALLYRKTKYVHTIHSIAEKASSSSRFLRKIDRILFRKTIQPVTISQRCYNSYISFYKQDNAVLINNGCPIKQATEKQEDVRHEIEKYKQNDNIPVFIHVARYNEAKNQKMMFETFLKLRENGYKFLLLVLGAHYENSGYMHLNDSDDIKILGEKSNVGDYLSCADYFVLSSLWEGLPISLIEAMSMGVVPICTPAGGIPDVIKDGTNGFVTDTFEQEDFYKKIKKCITKESHITKEKIMQHYNENFTIKICADNYIKVYRS